ncbi:3',5'-cyclic adenosine monophosphate phosphodiesterase CpdA [Pantoea ananatis]|uniref:metallophosphoesterase n=1 Tax=Pantoea ananas TaxID=553 RepID=UPI000B7D2EC5|nr:metallophosphoesterase [Pantoea ananatis]AWQ21378.1 hypothetical protein C1N63_21565 [Pantoea ananatis]MCW0318396.1 3',5'-cyclic adenosine monophosphate phosphodiesterase CpdA [Pantoea ananatis]MCW0336564.1 3',5'-cyclic adenosine monophosphate phosphodiesterase CpdA [Pantoea ananatis]MCW0384530.1 3',5'-cyclic adenosine monophosphate phosphodiesterase CpdA [Pantoea ananatis]MCW0409055.1 3',5'-cyclic adenosine monophosphate phosphodiesterase CpdA [Pantoea ananatis]
MLTPHSLSLQQRELLADVAALYQPPLLRPLPARDNGVRFGLMADPQYADIAPDVDNHLYYRNGLLKLHQAITALNAQPLDFVVTLGDLVDRDWHSYAAVLPVYQELKHPHAVVLGNHDAQTIASRLEGKVALPKSYYAFRFNGWRFIVYDGNDMSLYCNALNGTDRQQAAALLTRLQHEHRPHAQPWNGAVGAQQLVWIEQQLQAAQQCGESIVVFGHYPLAPGNTHMLMNADALVDLFTRYQVRACFAGHDHRGGYARILDTDFFIMKGMLDGPLDVPFAWVEADGEMLRVQGYGGEISRG